MDATPTQQLIEIRLGQPFAVWLAAARAQDPQIGLRRIRDLLHDRTGMRVSHETIRAWCAENVTPTSQTA